MPLSTAEKLDITNIGLMIVACCVAMVIPFETFLFSYAILGPLHYLTEISWLHDRKYYTREKYDPYILIAIGLLITVNFFAEKIELQFPESFDANLSYMALLCAIVFVTVKNKFYRIGGILLVIFTSQISHNFLLFFTIFLPTLVHVYIFTGIFMLYGALKSHSRFGIASVIALALCPIILFFVLPDKAFYAPTSFSMQNLTFFRVTNIHWLQNVNHIPAQVSLEKWDDIIYHSKDGILLMRFVAFAYTYHYLNWFSKTNIIQWHKVPKSRFVFVIILWIVSVGLYIKDFTSGLQWLIFLSFLHVLLEFPLNVTSFLGVVNYFKQKLSRTSVQKA